MIFVVGGMPRAGSRLYFYLIEELMILAGHPNAEKLREKFGAQLPARTLHQFHLLELIKFDRLSRTTNTTFAIRTHTAPTWSIKAYMATGRFKGTYVYRDPRDVIVSALERGKIMREKGDATRFFGIGPYRTFARLQTLEGALRWFRWQQYPRWKRWSNCSNVLMSKYEDNITRTEDVLERIADFFGLNTTPDQISQIAATFKPGADTKRADYYSEKASAGGGKLLNKGVIGRYREVMNASEQDLCNSYLADILKDMGYST